MILPNIWENKKWQPNHPPDNLTSKHWDLIISSSFLINKYAHSIHARMVGTNLRWWPLECLLSLDQFTSQMGVSIIGGTPKSSILIGFSLLNHPFWGTPIYGNLQVATNHWSPVSCCLTIGCSTPASNSNAHPVRHLCKTTWPDSLVSSSPLVLPRLALEDSIPWAYAPFLARPTCRNDAPAPERWRWRVESVGWWNV